MSNERAYSKSLNIKKFQQQTLENRKTHAMKNTIFSKIGWLQNEFVVSKSKFLFLKIPKYFIFTQNYKNKAQWVSNIGSFSIDDLKIYRESHR